MFCLSLCIGTEHRELSILGFSLDPHGQDENWREMAPSTCDWVTESSLGWRLRVQAPGCCGGGCSQCLDCSCQGLRNLEIGLSLQVQVLGDPTRQAGHRQDP